jgi:hypothetical protein
MGVRITIVSVIALATASVAAAQPVTLEKSGLRVGLPSGWAPAGATADGTADVLSGPDGAQVLVGKSSVTCDAEIASVAATMEEYAPSWMPSGWRARRSGDAVAACHDWVGGAIVVGLPTWFTDGASAEAARILAALVAPPELATSAPVADAPPPVETPPPPVETPPPSSPTQVTLPGTQLYVTLPAGWTVRESDASQRRDTGGGNGHDSWMIARLSGKTCEYDADEESGPITIEGTPYGWSTIGTDFSVMYCHAPSEGEIIVLDTDAPPAEAFVLLRSITEPAAATYETSTSTTSYDAPSAPSPSASPESKALFRGRLLIAPEMWFVGEVSRLGLRGGFWFDGPLGPLRYRGGGDIGYAIPESGMSYDVTGGLGLPLGPFVIGGVLGYDAVGDEEDPDVTFVPPALYAGGSFGYDIPAGRHRVIGEVSYAKRFVEEPMAPGVEIEPAFADEWRVRLGMRPAGMPVELAAEVRAYDDVTLAFFGARLVLEAPPKDGDK